MSTSAERRICERCSRRVEVRPGEWGRIYSGRPGMERFNGLFLCANCVNVAVDTCGLPADWRMGTPGANATSQASQGATEIRAVPRGW